jgi:hypothetical protein
MKKLNVGLYVLCFALLSGCSTSPVKLSEARYVEAAQLYAYQEPVDHAATLVMVRDSGLPGSGCTFGFYINGKVVADFNTSQKATFYVPAGEYRLGAGYAKKGACLSVHFKERETSLKAGQTKIFRISVGDGGLDIMPFSQEE